MFSTLFSTCWQHVSTCSQHADLKLYPVDFPDFSGNLPMGSLRKSPRGKSVNRPDPTFTHRFHGYSPKMRSGVWIRPISRFFRKFADGEPTKIRKIPKIVRVPPPRLGREARHATTQRAPKIGPTKIRKIPRIVRVPPPRLGREAPRDDPKGP